VAELRSRGPRAIADLTAALKNPALRRSRGWWSRRCSARRAPGAESALSHAAGDADGDVAGTAKRARTRCDEARMKADPGP